MRIIPTPSLSTKVAAGIDIAATLAIEHVGYTFSLPFWHPAIVGTVAGVTFALFKWKDEITDVFVGSLQPIQNKNHYSFQNDEPIVMYNKKKRELKMRKICRRPFEPVLFV